MYNEPLTAATLMHTVEITAFLRHQREAETKEQEKMSMEWPSGQPAIRVPFFDWDMYKAVNLNAPPSVQSDGLDLPFNDIPTFFFNLGLQHSRVVLLSQMHEKLREGSVHLHQQLLQLQAALVCSSSSPCSSSSSGASSSDESSRGSAHYPQIPTASASAMISGKVTGDVSMEWAEVYAACASLSM